MSGALMSKSDWDALKDSERLAYTATREVRMPSGAYLECRKCVNSGEASEADYMNDIVGLAVLGYELDEDLNRLAKKYRRKAEAIAQRLGLKIEIGFVVADGGQTVLSVLKSEKVK